MEKSEEIIREKEPELYRAIVPFVEQMPSFGRGATQDNWTQMRDELETATVASVEGKGDLSLIRTIFAGDMKTMRPFLIGDLREFFRAYPALLWLASRVAPEETIVPLAIFQNRIDLLPSSFDVKKAIPWIRSREMAKHLHGLFPSKTTTTSSLEDWAGHGNLGYVLWGLEEVGPNGEALMAAIISDNSSVVRAFLEDARSDPGANKNEAIRAASR